LKYTKAGSAIHNKPAEKRREKNPSGINPRQLAGKGQKKNPGINPGQPAEKGKKKKPCPSVEVLKPDEQNLEFQDLDGRTDGQSN
jgi:hypothetical protein